MVVGPGGDEIDSGIEAQEHQGGNCHTADKERRVVHFKQGHDLLQGRESKGNMHQCYDDGQEEDHLYLPADGGAHFCVTEPHLPHDPETLAVLISLGDLLIVDDQHSAIRNMTPR